MNNYISTLTSVSSDTLIILVLLVIILGIGFKFGRNQLVSLILAIYVAAFLYVNIFFASNFVFVEKSSSMLFWNKLGIFLLFLIPVNLLINKSLGGYESRGNRFVKIGLLAIALLGLTLAIFYHVVPITSVHNFSSGIDKLFASSTAYTLWLLIPLIVLFF